MSRWLRIAVIVLCVVIAALLWRYSPLSEYTNSKYITALLERASHYPWAPALVLGAYIIGGLLVLPLTVLVAATAVVFGPWLGFAYAYCGALLSAAVTFPIGSVLGSKLLRDLLGERLERITAKIEHRGIVAFAILRNVPVAPFSIVNVVAGAVGVRFRIYFLGSAIGMLPGIVVVAFMGDRVREVFTDPSPASIATLVGAVALWVGLAVFIEAKFGQR